MKKIRGKSRNVELKPPVGGSKLYFNFSIIYFIFIFIENKCLSDVIWADANSVKKKNATRTIIYTTGNVVQQPSFVVL